MFLTITVLSVIVLVVAVNFYALWRLGKRWQQVAFAIHQDLESLRKDFKTVSQGMTGIGKNMQKIEHQFRDVSMQTKEIADIAQSEPTESVYQHARELLAHGAAIEEVMESCGLTRAEAMLISQIKSQNEEEMEFDSVEDYLDVRAHKENNVRKNLRGRYSARE
jgi:uncharacterized protein YoxC